MATLSDLGGRSGSSRSSQRPANPNTVELALTRSKDRTCERLVPTLPRGNTLLGRSASPRCLHCGVTQPTRSVEDGIPTRERGNENQALLCLRFITNSTVLPLIPVQAIVRIPDLANNAVGLLFCIDLGQEIAQIRASSPVREGRRNRNSSSALQHRPEIVPGLMAP